MRKYINLTLLILSLSSLSLYSQNSEMVASSNQKIDSLINLYFKIIESQILNTKHIDGDSITNAQFFEVYNDTILLNIYFHEAVDLMEKVTDIRSPVFETYSPIYMPTMKTLEKWKRKIKSIRHLLIWEKDKNRINRKDFDIYISTIRNVR